MPAQAPATATSKEKEQELFLALRQGNLEAIKKELQQGDVKLNRLLGGYTPLSIAARNGHIPVVKYLVDEAHADVATINLDNQNALSGAAFFGKLDVVKYLTEHKCTNFKPHKDGTVALSLAHSKQHHMVVDYLVSKGATPLPKKLSDITTLFYDEKANAEINIDAFTLLAHTKLPIMPSQRIKGMAHGGTLYLYQPQVLLQGDDAPCIDAHLQEAAQKLGGTKEQHKKTDPIVGVTCAYHAIKNGLVGLMLLHDYAQLATCNDSKKRKKIAQWVNADIKNLTDLKTHHFDAATFLERLQAKIWMINYEQNSEEPSYQGLNVIQEHSIKHEINNTLNTLIQERSINNQYSHGTALSFVTGITLKNIYCSPSTNSKETLYRNNNITRLITEIESSQLKQQIALFRTQWHYRHAFSLGLDTKSPDGYGANTHAITVIIEKRGPTVNVILGESNNAPHMAIKNIVFDFINLFIDATKCTLSNAQLQDLTRHAVHPFGCSITTPEKGLPSFESLVQEYIRIKNNCTANNAYLLTKRHDAHYAFLLLSEIKHIYAKVLQRGDSKEYMALLRVLDAHGLGNTMLHTYAKNSTELKPLKEEIALHTLIAGVAHDELNERMITFIDKGNAAKVLDALRAGASPHATRDGNTALGIAASKKDLSIVQLLIVYGAHVNTCSKNGSTPLMQAIRETQNKAIIEYLLLEEAKVNQKNNAGNEDLALNHEYCVIS